MRVRWPAVPRSFGACVDAISARPNERTGSVKKCNLFSNGVQENEILSVMWLASSAKQSPEPRSRRLAGVVGSQPSSLK